jgi:hypothetical protein
MKWEEYVHKLNIEVDKGRYDIIESVAKGDIHHTSTPFVSF